LQLYSWSEKTQVKIQPTLVKKNARKNTNREITENTENTQNTPIRSVKT